MQVQLIEVFPGIAAAAWQNGHLESLTLPQASKEEAIATLGDYLKMEPHNLQPGSDLGFCQRQLANDLSLYFQGKPVKFNVSINWGRLTAFQGNVLKIVHNIPYGQNLSYGEIAKLLGYRKGAARAVGGAVGANPWLLVVPCHRVLAASKGLGGFSSGLAWKEKLLQIEEISYRTSGCK